VPIGEHQLSDGLRHEIDAEFYTATTRTPAVYRGNPFQIEVGVVFGGAGGARLELDANGSIQKTTRTRRSVLPDIAVGADRPAHLLRFANRVPLLYDQESCAITKATIQTNWRGYGLQQAKGALPLGPLVILVHMASVWVPFTSEAKEAIAPYPEVIREIRLGLQECGRKLAAHLRREGHVQDELEKRVRIRKYLPHVGLALQQLLELNDDQRNQTVAKLEDILRETRSL
jgi:DNA topoisomerase-6 subunit B